MASTILCAAFLGIWCRLCVIKYGNLFCLYIPTSDVTPRVTYVRVQQLSFALMVVGDPAEDTLGVIAG